jgi:hypothetical protein
LGDGTGGLDLGSARRGDDGLTLRLPWWGVVSRGGWAAQLPFDLFPRAHAMNYLFQ